ncbi:serine protein kinase RIO [Actinopolymorpha alba]|uniref:serine protein kinase RIO n=1 Tax=Actinopolymorpha alba TaxID=533267 RepID=UPI00035E4007|nr:RIO1 family regulatory kinase/ATPase [Actinopolymorpha alba]
MRKRNPRRYLSTDNNPTSDHGSAEHGGDDELWYDAFDDGVAPVSARMRRRRSDDEPAPRARGRMTEEARARLAKEREDVAIADGPPTGYRWTTWDDAGSRGPEPYPDWLVTDLAAVDTEFGILKTGKEADVFLIERGVPDTEARCLLASKRYRSADHRLFHRDAGYLEGRRARKSREQRAIANRTDFGRNLIAQQWAITEFAALLELWEAGAPVPYPVQHLGTELLMEFVGDEDGTAAPRLAQLRPDPDQLAELWQQLVEAMVLLGRRGYTHGDLSAYNLLVHQGELVLIDLPQLVDLVTNPQGRGFLERDTRRICEWFVDRGLPATVADPVEVVAMVLDEAGVST